MSQFKQARSKNPSDILPRVGSKYNKDENALRFALSAIRGELLERE